MVVQGRPVALASSIGPEVLPYDVNCHDGTRALALSSEQVVTLP